MVAYGLWPPATALLALLPVAMCLASALGAGLFLAALNVRYRDIRYAISPLIQVWMFCSVILPFSDVRARLAPTLGGWVWLYGLNPVGAAIEGLRWCLLHPYMRPAPEAPWLLLALGAASSAVMLVAGLVYFRHTERTFADVV
jgi:lipopolysaccharide transport system permease protein